MRIWLLFSFSVLFAITAFTAESPERTDLAGAISIRQKTNYTLEINTRLVQPSGGFPYGEGSRKDLVLKVFFPQMAEYRIVVKIPRQTGSNGAFFKYDHIATRFKIEKIVYSGAMSSREQELSSTGFSLKPVVLQNSVKYSFDIPVTNQGLYYIVFSAEKNGRYEKFPLSLIMRLKSESEADISELMEKYFTLLKSINAILIHKNHGAYFSDYEKAKLSSHLLELRKIKSQIKELTEEEKSQFRHQLFNHPEMKAFIENVRRIKRSFLFSR